MSLDQIIDKYLPFTKEDRSCAIKKQKKTMLRDAMKCEILEYTATQIKALINAGSK